MAASVELVECPRDAWQGQARIIATADKISYLRRLIELGFRHLDAVSFVSPRYVPQMADSEQVLQGLLRDGWRPDVEIIGIVVNDQGIRRALATAGVSTLGYPHSVSPSFLQVNAHLTPDESLALVRHLVRVCGLAHRGKGGNLSMASVTRTAIRGANRWWQTPSSSCARWACRPWPWRIPSAWLRPARSRGYWSMYGRCAKGYAGECTCTGARPRSRRRFWPPGKPGAVVSIRP